MTTVTLGLSSVPTFVLGLGAIYIFAVWLDLLPSGGMQTLGKPGSLFDFGTHLLLPALVELGFPVHTVTGSLEERLEQIVKITDLRPLITVAERLERKGGREVVARCPGRNDAQETADWLVDRFSRLSPGLPVTASVEPGGGQFLVVLATGRR